MADSFGGVGASLFAGTAWHYARYRPGYPQSFFDDMVRRFQLDGTGRLLDLGCGTGQLTVPLASHVAEAVGVDPEPTMLVEAAGRARAAGVTTVRWVQGSSEDLPAGLGRFRLVTMGRSFHWMDRERVLASLADSAEDEGALVIANDSCLVGPATEWQRAIEDVQRRFLSPQQRSGRATAAEGRESHEEILARSPFRRVRRTVHEFTRSWTIEQAIGYLYSTSLPLHRLLGDRRSAFEQAVTDAMLAIDPTGCFLEPVALEVLTATKS
ncbi:class I SAM-dependent methyltransferase [Nocardia gipuzkoensis]|uniref:class I SAM-dependent methyltransferase n=1 Tax=Nocardia gipuzkoensis TaxID=2749991 RepID=UPI001E453980|nr:class I SAM-dependent methyltransferase [Nocardia gipuzkoensis]UGT67164.1 class I SAM-dependent methyltransferase [Nocardia gipuzkoensis]